MSASNYKENPSMSSDTASTHSTVSTATTLKGSESPSKKKWFSLSSDKPANTQPQYVKKSDEWIAKRAIHNEAIASYLSMR
ncbi:hypothetical protein NUU61_002399 [Penicillium alfredii]|uniref:Uncharacterized protein n=1 Tax=Penicillium alfredii TaxID=1506179 RepID=A0A9W9FS78_9EURO|nr:uncharacterized protein NUU61_002399 [Penicillium alfredii]KAJ5105052.1 hypothetical protein NUU61_002399 [Penicillium alfredii]